MLHDHKDALNVLSPDRLGDLFGVERLTRLAGHVSDRLLLYFQYRGRRLLTGFDAGLVVGVDIDQRGIQPHGTLVERGQGTHGLGVNLVAQDRDRLATGFIERLPRALIKAV